MKIKVQTRKLAASCSKHCFKVVDGTDEVSSKHCFEVVDGCSKHCFEVVDRADEVSNYIYSKAKLTWFEIRQVKLTWFEEIFEEYKSLHNKTHSTKVLMNCTPKVRQKKSNFWGSVHSTPDTMRFFNFKDFLQLLLTHIKLF
ncbi:chlorohydrolase [Streptococcus pneumoniae]|uniref:hypothetical protein n=1 Tax=Streptococcus pneumoniae TaxID=1313 RepID=UPI000618DBB7|nr:hypothetical protein [Streptococcus pneumoniae]CRG76498.1 chlorohydrolase [Streptococcus pneumoniae]